MGDVVGATASNWFGYFFCFVLLVGHGGFLGWEFRMGFGSASFVISYFPSSRVLVGRDVRYKYNSCSMVIMVHTLKNLSI